MGGIHNELLFQIKINKYKPNKNAFSDCLKRLYDKSCCLRSVGR